MMTYNSYGDICRLEELLKNPKNKENIGGIPIRLISIELKVAIPTLCLWQVINCLFMRTCLEQVCLHLEKIES